MLSWDSGADHLKSVLPWKKLGLVININMCSQWGKYKVVTDCVQLLCLPSWLSSTITLRWWRSQPPKCGYDQTQRIRHREWWLSLYLLRLASVQFSCSVVSDSLRPHESQHARPPCPSPTPRVHSDSRPSSQWCHPAILSSVIPFSSCPQSLPASESFPMSQVSLGCLICVQVLGPASLISLALTSYSLGASEMPSPHCS